MPRPRKPLPPILKAESLDDGREIRPKDFTDDFTGETLPVVQDLSPARAMLSATEIRGRELEARRRIAQTALEHLGITPRVLTQAPMVEVVPKGMTKIGELAGKALLVPARPWRRITKS